MRNDSISIAGWSPYSSVDWPGKLVATLFLQGCPWRCSYCYNATLQPFVEPSSPVLWDDVLQHLSGRVGLLDGVVFSGGEPLAQPAVLDAMAEVRSLGFSVGVHTSGAYPSMLEKVLSLGLVDWVGLDVKALPDNYVDITGVAKQSVERCILAVRDSGVPHEFRLTYPEGHPNSVIEVYDFTRSLGCTAPFFVQPTDGSPRYQFDPALVD